MPFGNPAINSEQARRLELIYSQWIKPTVESIAVGVNSAYRIDCHRADKTQRPGDIITHVIDQLVNADLVIADLSGQNPNVFYELGVRHAVHNNTILTAQDIEDIPFDLRALRTIGYCYDPEQMLIFRDRLIEAINGILMDTNLIDNPVRRYLQDKAVHDLVSQSMPSSFDVVKSMASELDSLRKNLEHFAGQMRQVVETVATTNAGNLVGAAVAASTLEEFEGIWQSSSGGTYCARVISGHLFIPYCYSGSNRLTGHYFDCTAVGETLLGRFEWIGYDLEISGFTYLQLTEPSIIEGGWWYSHDVSFELRHNFSQLNASIPRMNTVTWKKISNGKSFPEWAERYFSLKLYEKK